MVLTMALRVGTSVHACLGTAPTRAAPGTLWALTLMKAASLGPGQPVGCAEPTVCLCRVKTALARKEEAVSSLRRQHEVGPQGPRTVLPEVGAAHA